MAGGADSPNLMGMITAGIIFSVMASLAMADFTDPVIISVTILVTARKRIQRLVRAVITGFSSHGKSHVTRLRTVNRVWSVNSCQAGSI